MEKNMDYTQYSEAYNMADKERTMEGMHRAVYSSVFPIGKDGKPALTPYRQ
jgi:hypothetical protein